MHRYIGYSREIAGSRSVGRPPEYFPVYLEFGKWVHRVCGTGPRNIFRCIYDFENVGAPGLWDRSWVYFRAYLEFWKCRCMGLWGKFSGPAGYFPGIWNIENWHILACQLLVLNFFNRSEALQRCQWTSIMHSC